MDIKPEEGLKPLRTAYIFRVKSTRKKLLREGKGKPYSVRLGFYSTRCEASGVTRLLIPHKQKYSE